MAERDIFGRDATLSASGLPDMLHHEVLRRLCLARDLLREWDDAPVPVSAVARRSGISQYHFIRLFRAVFGESPHQYRKRAQIEKARHLLALTDTPATEVCLRVGFSSLGSFSTTFRRAVGESPSAYRRKYQGHALHITRGAIMPGCFSLMGAISPQLRNFEEAPSAPA